MDTNKPKDAVEALDVSAGSALSLEDARTVCEMEAVCYSEGIGPDSTSLLKQICRQHPELVREFRFPQSTDAGVITERVMVEIGDRFPDLPTHQFNAIYSALLRELEKHLSKPNTGDVARPAAGEQLPNSEHEY